VALCISGDAGGAWFLSRAHGAWNLYLDVSQKADAEVVMDQEIAWRLFTRGIRPDEVLPKVTITGDIPLGRKVLDTVSVIA
jgi:hypothetical protein